MPAGRLKVTLHGPFSRAPSARLRSSERSSLYFGSLARIASLMARASSEESSKSCFWFVSLRKREAAVSNVAAAKNSRRCILFNLGICKSFTRLHHGSSRRRGGPAHQRRLDHFQKLWQTLT